MRSGFCVARLPTVIELLEKLPLDHDDRFGLHLRNALTGKLELFPAVTSDLDTLLTAYQFVGRTDVGVDPERVRSYTEDTEQLAQRLNADKELALNASPAAFVGRNREQIVLREFARTGHVIDRRFAKGS